MNKDEFIAYELEKLQKLGYPQFTKSWVEEIIEAYRKGDTVGKSSAADIVKQDLDRIAIE